jgi:surface antigen
MNRLKLTLLSIATIALLAGCNEPGPKTQTGAAVGAAGGAIMGGIMGGSRGALTGAALGGVTGAAIGANEDQKDRERYYRNGRYYYR